MLRCFLDLDRNPPMAKPKKFRRRAGPAPPEVARRVPSRMTDRQRLTGLAVANIAGPRRELAAARKRWRKFSWLQSLENSRNEIGIGWLLEPPGREDRNDRTCPVAAL